MAVDGMPAPSIARTSGTGPTRSRRTGLDGAGPGVGFLTPDGPMREPSVDARGSSAARERLTALAAGLTRSGPTGCPY
ncbi:hypothetical protein ADK70_19720 [Streptomyces rimosus subsp. pseudoverticillatus]|nr:hypothetical protein ADK70_19720 [Streptomyces rimosus subsp. pseudoverticillatus]